MPIVRAADAAPFEIHGSRFTSYVAPSRGSTQLCAWQLTVPPDLVGIAHQVNREEVVLVLDGQLLVTINGRGTTVGRGDVAFVPAGSELRVDAGEQGATAWVTTTPGIEAVTADGTVISPPWAR